MSEDDTEAEQDRQAREEDRETEQPREDRQEDVERREAARETKNPDNHPDDESWD